MMMKEIILTDAAYTKDSGFMVEVNNTVGGAVIIKNSEDSIILENDSEEEFLETVYEYMYYVDEETAELAAAKPWVESWIQIS